MSKMSSISVAEARDLDRRAIEELGMPSSLLMENAGRSVADRARALGSRWVILCGPGNNGGDGLCAARHLGTDATVYVLAEPSADRSPDTRLQWQLLEQLEFEFASGDPDPAQSRSDVVWIDAMFGTGLTRGLKGRAADWVERFNRFGGPRICVDIPSGLDGDTGAVIGEVACRAHETVTFHAIKHGLLAAAAKPWVGRVVCASLGLPPGWGLATSSTS